MHTYTYQLAEPIIRRNVSSDYFTFAHFIFFDVIDILNESLEFNTFLLQISLSVSKQKYFVKNNFYWIVSLPNIYFLWSHKYIPFSSPILLNTSIEHWPRLKNPKMHRSMNIDIKFDFLLKDMNGFEFKPTLVSNIILQLYFIQNIVQHIECKFFFKV